MIICSSDINEASSGLEGGDSPLLYRQQQIKVLHYTWFQTYTGAFQTSGIMSHGTFATLSTNYPGGAGALQLKEAAPRVGGAGLGAPPLSQRDMGCWCCDGIPSMLLQEAVHLETTDGLCLNGSESSILIHL